MPTSMLNLWNTQVRNFRDPGFRNRYYYNMSKFPIAGDLIRFQDYSNYWNDYFKNRPGAGGWENVKYPSLMAGAGTVTGAMPTTRATVGFVSKNLTKLYDRKDPERWKPALERPYKREWTPATEPRRRVRTNVRVRGGRFGYY